jgi:hypothetical protein
MDRWFFFSNADLKERSNGGTISHLATKTVCFSRANAHSSIHIILY